MEPLRRNRVAHSDAWFIRWIVVKLNLYMYFSFQDIANLCFLYYNETDSMYVPYDNVELKI